MCLRVKDYDGDKVQPRGGVQSELGQLAQPRFA